MGVLLFGRTQDAYGTPFDPTDPDAIAAGLTSSNTVQKAIIEAKNDAINNDRYPFQAYYGGNANVGRYFELFPGLASYPDAPFVTPENSVIKQITFGCTGLSTGTVGIFKTSDLVNPIYSFSLTNEQRKTITGLNVSILAGDEVAIRVTAGSFNKPFMRTWINTAT